MSVTSRDYVILYGNLWCIYIHTLSRGLFFAKRVKYLCNYVPFLVMDDEVLVLPMNDLPPTGLEPPALSTVSELHTYRERLVPAVAPSSVGGLEK